MLICGLDNSGKTTLIKKYCQDLDQFAAKNNKPLVGGEKPSPYANTEFYHSTPFINIEKILLPDGSMPCVVYDLSGQVSFPHFFDFLLQGRYRESWSFFYPDVDGILFVVDASDHERLSVVVEILEVMARHPCLVDRKIPFIILANKSDCPEAIDEAELRKVLQLDKLKSMNQLKYDVKQTIGITGYGVEKCMKAFE